MSVIERTAIATCIRNERSWCCCRCPFKFQRWRGHRGAVKLRECCRISCCYSNLQSLYVMVSKLLHNNAVLEFLPSRIPPPQQSQPLTHLAGQRSFRQHHFCLILPLTNIVMIPMLPSLSWAIISGIYTASTRNIWDLYNANTTNTRGISTFRTARYLGYGTT